MNLIHKHADDVAGLEYDWLAVDCVGQVALFSTAGGGYPPKQFLADTDVYDEAIKCILSLPVVCEARQSPEIAAGLANTWLDAARRGLYSFDADPEGGPYRLVGVPAKPTTSQVLPVLAKQVVERISLRSVNFGLISLVTKEMLVGVGL